jgi:hypothetical protein
VGGELELGNGERGVTLMASDLIVPNCPVLIPNNFSRIKFNFF